MSPTCMALELFQLTSFQTTVIRISILTNAEPALKQLLSRDMLTKST
jgi:hypothetical protein